MEKGMANTSGSIVRIESNEITFHALVDVGLVF